jgi:hypothetical protein
MLHVSIDRQQLLVSAAPPDVVSSETTMLEQGLSTTPATGVTWPVNPASLSSPAIPDSSSGSFLPGQPPTPPVNVAYPDAKAGGVRPSPQISPTAPQPSPP